MRGEPPNCGRLSVFGILRSGNRSAYPRLLQGQEDLLRGQGKVAEADAESVVDGVGHGRGGGYHNVLTYSARAPWAILHGCFNIISNDLAWDIGGGKPNLFVRVNNGNRKVTSPKKQDSYLANLNYKTGIKVGVGDQLEVSVWDKDALSDDKVGSGTVLITGAALRDGAIAVSFGRVKALVLVFK